MLFIYHNDSTATRLQVGSDFFQSVKQGNRTITYRDKSESIAQDLSTTNNGRNTLSGYKLTKGDETLLNVGYLPEKPSKPKRDWEKRGSIKGIKKAFSKFIKETYGFELAHGHSINKVYFKTTQKVVLY